MHCRSRTSNSEAGLKVSANKSTTTHVKSHNFLIENSTMYGFKNQKFKTIKSNKRIKRDCIVIVNPRFDKLVLKM